MESRAKYYDELETLHNQISDIISDCRQSSSDYLKVIEGNYSIEEGKKELKQREEKINDAEPKIEDSYIQIIATQQPVASDLRKVVSSIKIISHLERYHDHMYKAVKFLQKDNDLEFKSIKNFLIDCVQGVVKLIDKTKKAFDDSDSSLAKEAADIDEIIDKASQNGLDSLLSLTEKKLSREGFSLLLMMLRHLERAGDQICHICEWIIYANEGSRVEL